MHKYREWYNAKSRGWRFKNWIKWRLMYLKAAFTGGPTEWELYVNGRDLIEHKALLNKEGQLDEVILSIDPYGCVFHLECMDEREKEWWMGVYVPGTGKRYNFSFKTKYFFLEDEFADAEYQM